MLLFIGNTSSAMTVSGIITGSRKQPLPDVMVVLTPTNSFYELRYTLTNSEGLYRLDYSGITDSLQIRILGFNIEKKSCKISAQTQQLNFQVEEKDIRIQEVVVHTRRLWRSKDTVNYLVSRFTRYNDQTVADVFRKLPYLKVEGYGTIYYLDAPIDRFSIEQVDLPKGRFGLATTLLKPQDVFIIQVFKKRIKGKKRQALQIAINLKMK